MFFKWISVLLLLQHTLTFSFFKCEKGNCSLSSKLNVTEEYGLLVIDINEIERDMQCPNHINSQFCDEFKYQYNPYKDLVRRRQVLPVCIKCALCLSIAEEVRKIFDTIIRDSSYIEPTITRERVDDEFSENFCRRTFHSHDLRTCKNDTIIVKSSDCGTHIRTEFDGLWPKMMTDMCLLFVNQLNAHTKFSFFNQYRQQSILIDDYLCKGDGVFRECKNLINETQTHVPHSKKQSFWKKCFL